MTDLCAASRTSLPRADIVSISGVLTMSADCGLRSVIAPLLTEVERAYDHPRAGPGAGRRSARQDAAPCGDHARCSVVAAYVEASTIASTEGRARTSWASSPPSITWRAIRIPPRAGQGSRGTSSARSGPVSGGGAQRHHRPGRGLHLPRLTRRHDRQSTLRDPSSASAASAITASASSGGSSQSKDTSSSTSVSASSNA